MAANAAKGGSGVTDQKDAANYDAEAHQTSKQYTDASPEKRAEIDRRVREQREKRLAQEKAAGDAKKKDGETK